MQPGNSVQRVASHTYQQSFIDKVHITKKAGVSLATLQQEFCLSRGQLKYVLYVLKPSEEGIATLPDFDSPPIPDVSQYVRGCCSNEVIRPSLLGRMRGFFRWFFS